MTKTHEDAQSPLPEILDHAETMVWYLAELAREMRRSERRVHSALHVEVEQAMADAEAVDDILRDMLDDPENFPGSLAYNALARRRVMLLSTSSDLYLAKGVESDPTHSSISGTGSG